MPVSPSRKNSGGRRRGGTRPAVPQALNFDEDAEAPVGASARERYPRERAIEAGKTGGELPYTDITADDASPETLLDDDASRSPSARERRDAADHVLRTVDAGNAGLGGGTDEAEDAQNDPVGAAEARSLQARSRRHARDARFAEPVAAREDRERQQQRDNRR